jgi:DNA-binding PucR family transcriptional regulator
VDAVAQALQDVAETVEPDRLVSAILDRLRTTIPEFFVEDDVAYDMAAAVTANVRRFGQLAARGSTSEAIPVEASDLLQSTIQHGIPLISLLEAYRSAQGLAANWWQDELERRAPAAVAGPAIRKLHGLLVAYIDTAATQIRAAYDAERRAFESSADIRRAHLIRKLLAGEPLDPEAAARTLNHPLTVKHIAVVLWRVNEDSGGDAYSRTLDALATAAGTVRVLTLPEARHRTYAWLSSSGPMDLDRVAATRTVDGVRAAISGIQSGLDGFVRAHADATRAATVARDGADPGDRVAPYERLELITLLSRHPADRDRFVRRVLGPLAADTPQAARTRQTLRAYLETGSSPTRAAERLGIHRNTVTYRLQPVAELLVPHEDHRRLELELALYLREQTGPPARL